MLQPKKNSCKEFDNEKKFLRLENCPSPQNFSNGPSLIVSGMVTCGEQTLFSPLFSPAEKISILSAGETRAEIACSVGVLCAGESLFMFVLL